VKGFAHNSYFLRSDRSEFWPKEAPKAVRNFIQRSAQGYYDGAIFHRVVKGVFIEHR